MFTGTLWWFGYIIRLYYMWLTVPNTSYMYVNNNFRSIVNKSYSVKECVMLHRVVGRMFTWYISAKMSVPRCKWQVILVTFVVDRSFDNYSVVRVGFRPILYCEIGLNNLQPHIKQVLFCCIICIYTTNDHPITREKHPP